MTEEDCHLFAREVARDLKEPDRKQLRFNDIVRVAKKFYPSDVFSGVQELTLACDRHNTDMYVPRKPMHQVLEEDYSWAGVVK